MKAKYTGPMSLVLRIVTLLALLMLAPLAGAQGQDDAIILIAHPAFRDLEYRQTVLIAAPVPTGGHDARLPVIVLGRGQ